MKKTQQLLMTLFCAFLALTALIYICGEFLQCDMTLFDDASRQTKFCVSTLMILLTICLLPLSLRLFRFSRISTDLQQRQAEALRRWGALRLTVMGLLLLVNTALYYVFGLESAYGYLAVVTLLCMPFVIPTLSRCQAEVMPEVEKSTSSDGDESNDNSDNDEETNSSHSQL